MLSCCRAAVRRCRKATTDHQESELLFYCGRNHAEAHAAGACPVRPALLRTQGAASDALALETEAWERKLRQAERHWRSAL